MTEPTTKAGRAIWDADNRPALTYAEFGEALAAIEAEARALDVERLARATAEVSGYAHAMGEPAADYHRDWAEKVAAEYARLAESKD